MMAYGPYNYGYTGLYNYPQAAPTLPQIPGVAQGQGTYYANSQIVQVAGKASVDMIRLEPYKGLLALDTTAPLLWVCTADGVGHVTATPFDITPHKETPPTDTTTDTHAIEQRIAALESEIKGLEEKLNACESGNTKREPKHSSSAQ